MQPARQGCHSLFSAIVRQKILFLFEVSFALIKLLGNNLLFQRHQGFVHGLTAHQRLGFFQSILDSLNQHFGLKGDSLALKIFADLETEAVIDLTSGIARRNPLVGQT